VIFLSTPVVLGFVLAKLVSQALAGNVNSGQHVVKGKLYPISLCGWGNSYMLKRLSWLRPCYGGGSEVLLSFAAVGTISGVCGWLALLP
jgi:hypothetical protein